MGAERERSELTGRVESDGGYRRAPARAGATTILVMAKEPRPGAVKTRLCPPFTAEQAAQLARAALVDTLETVRRAPAARRLLALDGEPGDWLPPGFDVIAQRGAGLDDRIANAFAVIDGPVLQIAMDTPQLTVAHLSVDWSEHDAWLGPADDGGYWILGLREADPRLIRGIPMSRPDTGALVLDRLHRAGLRVGQIPTLRDMDTAADAAAIAAAAPQTRFAARFRALDTPNGTIRTPAAAAGSTAAVDAHVE